MPITRPTLSFIKHFIIYGIGNVANRIITFILIPVTTRYLSVPEVGIIALLEMVELFLTTVFSQGLGPALWRRLSDKRNNVTGKTIIFSSFVGQFISNILIVALLYLFSGMITIGIGLPNDLIFILNLVFINSLMVAGTNFMLSLWRFYDKSGLFSIFSSFRFLFIVTLSIYFIIFLDLRIPGLVYAKIIVNGLSFALTVVYILFRHYSSFSPIIYLKIQKYGAYFVLLALVTPILNTINRMFINEYLTLSDVGIFSIAFKFGMLINILLVTPIQLTWLPMMYKLGNEERSKRYYKDFTYYYTILSTFMLLILAVWRYDLIMLFTTEDYILGAKFIPFVALAYVINGYRHFFMSGLAVNDKLSIIGYSSAGTIILNIVLNYFLISRFGMWGAIAALIISYLTLSSTIYFSSQLLVKVNWGIKKTSRVILCMLFFILLNEMAIVANFSYDLLIKFILTLSFIIVLKFFNLIGLKEINGIKSLFQNIINRLKNKTEKQNVI